MRLKDLFSSPVKLTDLILIRRRRVIQISMVTGFGLFAASLVARGITFDIFLLGQLSLIVTAILAYKRYIATSSYLLLGAMSSMLFALSATGAGVFDIAMLGYPGVIIFAALLGGIALFSTVLSLVLLQCVTLAWLVINDVVIPHPPILSWPHMLFIMVIFVITGFSVFILVQDIRRLMSSLQQEVAKVEKNRAHIQHLAHYDPLTNLPNRIMGERLFNERLRESEEKGLQLALLFIDLDNFKPINDALGHAAGDRFLQQISQTITDRLSAQQYLIRFGGDEFILLAPDISGKSEIDTLCKNLITWCSSEFEIMQTKIVVSASIGAAQAPSDGNQFKQLCRKADIAMYEAKRNGRNRYEYYDVRFDKENDEKFTLIQRLRPAVNANELEVYYQPLIDLESDKVEAVEALLRWPQNDGSMIFPDKFIPLAESSGLINPLGAWVLNQACDFCAKQHKKGHSNLTVAVNLSFAQFKDGTLPQLVEQALLNSNLAPEYLELELTETILADEKGTIAEQLETIKSLGVHFAIDDFGTGYSNLNYLRTFSASKLKIDRIFINTLGIEESDDSLVSAIINIAESLGMKTVAEGIENKAALDKLKSMGCNLGQGYYWSKPVPASEIERFMSNFD
ncbi:bifunctional diguanylate cyclase/phosphodiesterase [Alteromonas sp. ALT199]|uniref:putative bifunctional diguanylate cyclase/phosphodiesterase n=1 Tax=unclassified Alteromonas TaxID=2614992 RepID=UPI001BE92F44|nr:bifunctional diguanylate cyclase/phosphodiesterase [Alteromonas sp. ALT199]